MKIKLYTTLSISLAIIISCYLLSDAWKKTHRNGEVIRVTGLATYDFESDYIVWSGQIARKASELKEAYSLIKKDQSIVLDYLISKGIKQESIVFSSVNIAKDFSYFYASDGSRSEKFNGYLLSLTVEVSGNDVTKIETISREVTEIIDKGVEFNSFTPSYYYSGLDSLKLNMLAKATENAKQRAEKIAVNAGSSLGSLKSADMGIFQITGRNSTEDFSWGGTYNTTSKLKTARITVSAQYFTR
jgi:hypothetical protein